MRNQALIFLPLLAQVLLTAIVWVMMYRSRIALLRAERIHPQRLATASEAGPLLARVAGPSDNFSNLFELPVLFFVAAVTAYVTGQVDGLLLALANGFVLLRYAHSFIHVTYNRVVHRFLVYVAGGLVLWLMWLLLAWRLLGLMTA